MKNTQLTIRTTMLLFVLAAAATAEVKLNTRPPREELYLDLANDRATLIEEERVISLQKGSNRVDFSWDGTQIDKESIVFRPLEGEGKLSVNSVSFPPGVNALAWEIYTANPGPYRFRISYLMNGVGRQISYQGVVSRDEKTLQFKNLFLIQNQSGESFDGAQIALGFGKEFNKAVEAGDAIQLLAAKWMNVPIRKSYTFDERRFGAKTVPMHYVLKNIAESGLGSFPLKAGKVRLYQDDGHGTTIFLGEDWGALTPIGDEMSLYVGNARDVKVEKQKMVDQRINHRHNVYDTDETFRLKLENFKDEPVVLDVYEQIDGQWDMESSTFPFEKLDANRIVFHVQLPPKGEKVMLEYRFHRRNVW